METRIAMKEGRMHGVLTYSRLIGFERVIAELIADDIEGRVEELDDVLDCIDALHTRVIKILEGN